MRQPKLTPRRERKAKRLQAHRYARVALAGLDVMNNIERMQKRGQRFGSSMLKAIKSLKTALDENAAFNVMVYFGCFAADGKPSLSYRRYLKKRNEVNRILKHPPIPETEVAPRRAVAFAAHSKVKK